MHVIDFMVPALAFIITQNVECLGLGLFKFVTLNLEMHLLHFHVHAFSSLGAQQTCVF